MGGGIGRRKTLKVHDCLLSDAIAEASKGNLTTKKQTESNQAGPCKVTIREAV